jgi:hypothetical protein
MTASEPTPDRTDAAARTDTAALLAQYQVVSAHMYVVTAILLTASVLALLDAVGVVRAW